ncbi:MAG: hypothetical protein QM500_15395 [Methylococcales bacterium]
MKKTIYLHVGYHKTGTTYIQAALMQNVAELARKGILYYQDSKYAKEWFSNHTLALSIRQSPHEIINITEPPDQVWSRFLHDVRSFRGKCILVSSEVFIEGVDKKFIQKNSQTTQSNCVFYVREQKQIDNPMNAPLSPTDTRIKGAELADFVLKNSNNFIGEPSTVMFRRSDISIEEGRIFQFNGVDYHCLADLSLWLRLLSKGDAIYLKDELSSFRLHAGQEQRKEDVAIKCLTERYELLKQAPALGFLADSANRNIAVNTLLKILDQAMASGAISDEFMEKIKSIRKKTAGLIG